MEDERSIMRFVRTRMYLFLVLALAGCEVGPAEEITSTKPYADLIGATYSIVGDLYAYGVYESLNNRIVEYVTLVPPPGLGGVEYAFERPVPKGQVIRILSAWQQSIPFVSGVFYLVTFEQSDLPEGVPVRLELFRGNEGKGPEPNPAIYRKLLKDK